jgi:hypothetical protein
MPKRGKQISLDGGTMHRFAKLVLLSRSAALVECLGSGNGVVQAKQRVAASREQGCKRKQFGCLAVHGAPTRNTLARLT